MTAKEIAEKSWTLWNDYYKDGDKSSKEILSELEADIEALRIQDVVGRSEQLCDFLEWYDEKLTLEEREMDIKTYLDMKSHNCH